MPQYKVLADIANQAGVTVIPANTIVTANPIADIPANGNYGITISGIEVFINGERIAIEKSLLLMQSSGSAPSGQTTLPATPILPCVPCPQPIRTDEYNEVAGNIGYMVANHRVWQYAALAVIALAVYGAYRLLSSSKNVA